MDGHVVSEVQNMARLEADAHRHKPHDTSRPEMETNES